MKNKDQPEWGKIRTIDPVKTGLVKGLKDD